jgi:hypothetical protein
MVHAELPDYVKRTVKVLGHSHRDDTCWYCGDPVSWWRTAERPRWMLFDDDVREIKRRQVENGVVVYLDKAGVHWNHCRPQSIAV